MGPNLIALAIPFFFAGIAFESFVARKKKRDVYRLPDALADMGCGIAQQSTVLLYGGLLSAGFAWLYANARVVTLPVWAQWTLAFVGVDFVYYWWHRFSHEVGFMWAAHVVHHQSEDYNLAVALRQSVITSMTSWPFYAPLAVLGAPPAALAVSISLSTLYQFWIHTELVGRLGFVEGIINTPSAHRVHHATNLQYLDKNYGATLMIWDKLFGTYEPEIEACRYGITRPLNSFNAVWAQWAHWGEMVYLARKAPSVGEAVQVFFRGPGWYREWMGVKPKRPDGKYEVKPSRGARRYALAWFALASAGIFVLLMYGRGLAPWATVLCVGLIFLTLTVIGGILEGRRWVRFVEPVRYAALVGAVPVLLLTP